jgi:hypothetical protein
MKKECFLIDQTMKQTKYQCHVSKNSKVLKRHMKLNQIEEQ